ncbi:MAG: hypothetical protein KBS68_04530 [Clostridiales bacterium]|nr:hypothetical protein [Candidatus Crickella merdequi]
MELMAIGTFVGIVLLVMAITYMVAHHEGYEEGRLVGKLEGLQDAHEIVKKTLGADCDDWNK